MNSNNDRLTEKTLSERHIYDAGIFRLSELTVSLPDGRTAIRNIIRHNGASCILPVNGNDIVFVSQYRPAAGRIMLELPAGKLDGPDEDPYECAVRELREETGFTAQKIQFMRKYIPAAGYSDEVIHLYVATGLISGDSQPDSDEFVETVNIPAEEAYEMCLDGRIEDSKTVIAVMTYYGKYVTNKEKHEEKYAED